MDISITHEGNHFTQEKLANKKWIASLCTCMFVQVHAFGLVLAFFILLFSRLHWGPFCLCDLSCSIFICLFILFCFYFSLIENTQRERSWNWVLPRNEDTLKKNLCPLPFLCLVLKQQIAIYWNSSWNLMLKERNTESSCHSEGKYVSEKKFLRVLTTCRGPNKRNWGPHNNDRKDHTKAQDYLAICSSSLSFHGEDELDLISLAKVTKLSKSHLSVFHHYMLLTCGLKMTNVSH